MARSWNFPRWRNVVMQAVMCGVLGATVGLAALVDHRLRDALFLPLTNPISEGSITFRLPAGWKISTRIDEGGSLIQTAVDPQPGSERVMTISVQRVERLMPPVEYLHISGRLAGNLREQPADSITIDGWPGQYMPWFGARRSGDAAVEVEALVCCVILPDYQAVTLRLEKPAVLDPADRRLVREVIDSMSFGGLDHPQPGTLALGNDASVDIPADFVVFPQPDPLRRDRMIVSQTPQGQWISAQLIPLLLANQPVESLRQILAADEHQDSRDPGQAKRWLVAQVSAAGPDHWLIDPEPIERPELLVHHLATLTTNDKGQGLLVVLTATNPAGDDDLDQVWSQLETRIHLGGSTDLTGLLSTGAAAVADKAPLSTPPRQSWQLWWRGNSAQGWTMEDTDSSGKARFRQTRWRNWEGTITQMLEQCSPLEQAGDYSIQVQRSDAEAEPFSRFITLFEESTNVSDTISTRVGLLEPTVVDRPPAFVPSTAMGGWLANLPPKPLALWTDRFQGAAAELLFTPLLLLVHPVDSAAKDLRCFEVELSGTGQLSRWYFRPDGALDHADFPGKLALRPSTLAQVQSAMGNDPRLTVESR